MNGVLYFVSGVIAAVLAATHLTQFGLVLALTAGTFLYSAGVLLLCLGILIVRPSVGLRIWREAWRNADPNKRS